jgi:hypothetical protein
MSRKIVWFSCGVASACAAKLVPDAEVVYCDTSRDEHPDNARFFADVEKWIGRKITVIKSDKYTTIDEVFATGYMAGIAGAKCTTELKKIPRHKFQRADDIHSFGFTADELDRIADFERNNPELNLSWPLVEAGLTKALCIWMVIAAGIEVPAMYKLGYKNNNCLGCVKATSPKYWNDIRRDFPAAFEERATRSRLIGARLARYHGERIFLDELPADTTEEIIEDLSCGPQCGVIA